LKDRQVDTDGQALHALGNTWYSINRQVQKETCRHSVVTFTSANHRYRSPAPAGPAWRSSADGYL